MADGRRSPLNPTVRVAAYRFGRRSRWLAGPACQRGRPFSRPSAACVGPARRCAARVRSDPARSIFFQELRFKLLTDLLTCKIYRKITMHPIDLIQTSVDFLLKCLSNGIGPIPIGSL
jgi:hypothetical protein